MPSSPFDVFLENRAGGAAAGGVRKAKRHERGFVGGGVEVQCSKWEKRPGGGSSHQADYWGKTKRKAPEGQRRGKMARDSTFGKGRVGPTKKTTKRGQAKISEPRRAEESQQKQPNIPRSCDLSDTPKLTKELRKSTVKKNDLGGEDTLGGETSILPGETCARDPTTILRGVPS